MKTNFKSIFLFAYGLIFSSSLFAIQLDSYSPKFQDKASKKNDILVCEQTEFAEGQIAGLITVKGILDPKTNDTFIQVERYSEWFGSNPSGKEIVLNSGYQSRWILGGWHHYYTDSMELKIRIDKLIENSNNFYGEIKVRWDFNEQPPVESFTQRFKLKCVFGQ